MPYDLPDDNPYIFVITHAECYVIYADIAF